MSRSVDQAYASPQVHDAEVRLLQPGGSPTRVRYYIIALSMCMSLILYLDRFALAPITSTLLVDLDLTKEEFGRRSMWFFWLYAIFQVPAGALADRFGARKMLAIYVVAWSLATMALGFVQGLVGLIGLNAVMGAAQAGAYPAAGSFLKRWANPTARAKANSLVAAGGRIGALVAFAITAWLAVKLKGTFGVEQGWRLTLAVYGILGIVWATAFWLFFRDHPSEHPGCNQAEIDLIGREPPAPVRAPFPVAGLLLSSNVWLLSLSGFLVNVGWIFLTTWQTVYIMEKFSPQLREMFPNLAEGANLQDMKQVIAGRLTAFVLFAGMTGGIVGGIAADIFRRKLGPIWGRRVPGIIAGSVAGTAYLSFQFVNDIWIFVALMLVVSFTVDFGLGSLWATYQDIGGRHVGSVLGFANMWGNFGAGLCGWYYGWLADNKNWPLVFTISAIALFVMSASWFLVDPTKTLQKEVEPDLQ
ncbi:D-galactonate transporter [Anatilimnocola aggregata]|uniref:D-galactonate transporter n=1 Tax=Anatilimnocola aggregata TaxID=2528021 RepID=A0A517YFY1_9BACT|nr:MFS transporter [Anatilimnocola aggregata]QDU29133.1 D-galactonate transporter [Anatilimnocola aggregata]